MMSSSVLLVLLVVSDMRPGSILARLQDLGQVEEPTSESQLKSPSEIEQHVNDHNDEADLNKIWAGLGIVTDFPPGRCGCHEHGCPGRCTAQTIEISSKGTNPEYGIVRICNVDEFACWFLLFKKEDDWRFQRSVVYRESRYKSVEHRIVSCRDTSWLVVTCMTGGTGVSFSGEDWFEIGNNGLSEVLSLPVAGHSVQGDKDDYKLTSKVKGEALGDDCVVALQYEVFQGAGYLGNDLRWNTSVRRQLQFVWDASAEKFVLDKVNSDLGDDRHDPVLRYLSRHEYLN